MAPIKKHRTRPPIETPIEPQPHPITGCGRAYSVENRQAVLALVDTRMTSHPTIRLLKQQHVLPCTRTEERWRVRYNILCHIRPFRRTGNKRATTLKDKNLFYIACYRLVFCKASAAEINAYLYRMNFGNSTFRFYSSSQITCAEDSLGLSMKASSTTAYKALLPINVHKRWCFWNLPYPGGIADIKRKDLIDLDKCVSMPRLRIGGRGKTFKNMPV